MKSKTWIMMLSLAGCQPALDSLEVGDEANDVGSGESADETSGGELGECLAGTDLAGEMGFAFVPPCLVECAEAPGIPQLEIEWTRALELAASGFDHLVVLDADTLVLVQSSDPDQPELLGVSLVLLSIASGEQLGVVALEGALAGKAHILDVELTNQGELGMTWQTEGSDWVGVVTLAGEVAWSHELGPSAATPSTLRPTTEGLAALLPQAKLVRFDAAGSQLGQFEVEGWIFAPTPEGGFAVTGYDTRWYDLEGSELGDVAMDSAGLYAELRTLGDQGVVAAGIGFPFDVFDPSDAVLSMYDSGHADASWTFIHARSDAWCADEAEEPRTSEAYEHIAVIGQDRVLVGGRESVGYPLWQPPKLFEEAMDRPDQPLVDLVGFGVDSTSVLGRDRGLWLGNVVDLVAAEGFACALVTQERTTSTSLVVRKYAMP